MQEDKRQKTKPEEGDPGETTAPLVPKLQLGNPSLEALLPI